MTNTQRLTIRSSEIRSRLNEISTLADDQVTDEIRGEETKLQAEGRDVEVKLRAAVASDPEPRIERTEDVESRQLRELAARADAGAVFMAALDRGVPEGETRELQEHYGLGPNQIPLSMLRQPARGDRQDLAVTPAPGDVGQNQADIIDYVFPMACAGFLGIDMPTVAVGEAGGHRSAAVRSVYGPSVWRHRTRAR